MAQDVISDDIAAATRALMAQLRAIKAKGLSKNVAPVIRDNRPVVVALADDLFIDVVKRLHAHPSPVLLAVYYPASKRLELAEAGAALSDDAVPVGHGATIGTVLAADEALSLPGTWETIRVSQLQVS